MNNVILSAKYPVFANKLAERGYHVIESETVPGLITYERDHADMQCLIIDDTAFVLRECTRLADRLSEQYHIVFCDQPIGGKYTDNVRLNAAVLGRNVIANTNALDKNVREYCKKHDFRMIHVNQGYAKCSCGIVSNNALITSDNGIYNSLKEISIEVLKIRQGRVALDGAEYGFIGGASGLDMCGDHRTMYFSGNIKNHPDHQSIKTFCEAHDTEICSLTENELVDIGGMIFC